MRLLLPSHPRRTLNGSFPQKRGRGRFLGDFRSPRNLTTAADCTRENRSRAAAGSPQPRTTPPTSHSHSPRPAHRHGAKMRRSSPRSSRRSSHGVRPDGSRGGPTRPIDPRRPAALRRRPGRGKDPHNTPDGALPQSPFSALALCTKKGKRTDQGAQRSPRNLLRPGDPAPGCHRTTTAPHHAPDGRPHRPQPITLCREGGESKVSVLYAEKRKPIKIDHSPAAGAVCDGERAAVASAPSGRPPPPPDAIAPQSRLLLHANGRRTGATAGGHSTCPMTLAAPAPAPATATASSSLQRTRDEDR